MQCLASLPNLITEYSRAQPPCPGARKCATASKMHLGTRNKSPRKRPRQPVAAPVGQHGHQAPRHPSTPHAILILGQPRIHEREEAHPRSTSSASTKDSATSVVVRCIDPSDARRSNQIQPIKRRPHRETLSPRQLGLQLERPEYATLLPLARGQDLSNPAVLQLVETPRERNLQREIRPVRPAGCRLRAPTSLHNHPKLLKRSERQPRAP